MKTIAIAMRAKIELGSIIPNKDEGGAVVNEQLSFHGVSASSYPEDGSDENNTFARFSPSLDLGITIANPNLIGKFHQGQTFYLDFIDATTPDEGADNPSIKAICDELRGEIGHMAKTVETLRSHPQVIALSIGDGAHEKVDDRIKEAVTLLENARMSLGKVIQYSEKRESIFDIQKDPEKMGRLAHRRFCEASGMTEGEIADWDALSADAQRGWIAAGSAGAPVAQ